MTETHHDLQPEIPDQEARENSTEQKNAANHIIASGCRSYKRWLRIVLYILFILGGQSAALILGRLYFDKGGKSNWLSTLAQLGGFPLLIPCYFFLVPKAKTLTHPNNIVDPKPASFLKQVALVYVPLGILSAANCFLYSVGMQYLPVSTVSLIAASHLAFNAFFSYFLNSQKFTPFIVNSLVLLTISSVLLVANNNSEKPAGISKGQYAAGFICTICGTAVYGLLLALQQLTFRKVLKRLNVKVVLDVILYQSIVASGPILVGLFASGDWKGLKREMEEYALGKVSYVMTVIGSAICWQVFAFGTVGLIFEVSSLYSVAISVVGLPIVPVIAVFVFHDKMDGIKGMSMVLAIWGFISYVYQQYVEHKRSNINENRIASDLSEDHYSHRDREVN